MESKDQRRERRWNLRIHLRVFDEEHDLLLGHAVDIATKGMQVISEEAIAIERTYKLSLEVILPSGDWELVPIRALGVWSRRSPTGLYQTGFHIFQMSPKALANIQQLIDSLQVFEEGQTTPPA